MRRKDDIECKMDYFIAGRNVSVVAALSDEDPHTIVVTVYLGGK